MEASVAPNKPATVVRTVRIDDTLWTEALQITERRGTTVSDVLRECLARYVRRHTDDHSGQQQ